MKASAILTLCTVTFVAILACHGCGPNSDGSKLGQLERLESQLPIFPSMTETDRHTMSKGTLANITKCYKSNSAYEEVKGFYLTELNKAGWVFKTEHSVKDWGTDFGGRELIFDNENFGSHYYLAIYYKGEKTNDPCTYGVTVGWRE